MTEDTPISYEAAARGTPVLSSAGTQIGTLEHVLEVPEVDVFDGIVIATKAGLWTAPSFSETVTSGKVGTHGITETAPR